MEFTVIALTETWFNDVNCDRHNIEQYELIETHRTTRKGGGVALFVRKTVDYKPRTDLDLFNEFIEGKFIEIDRNSFDNSKAIIVGLIYRPPNTDIYECNKCISTIQSQITRENKECYLLGGL